MALPSSARHDSLNAARSRLGEPWPCGGIRQQRRHQLPQLAIDSSDLVIKYPRLGGKFSPPLVMGSWRLAQVGSRGESFAARTGADRIYMQMGCAPQMPGGDLVRWPSRRLVVDGSLASARKHPRFGRRSARVAHLRVPRTHAEHRAELPQPTDDPISVPRRAQNLPFEHENLIFVRMV